MTNQKYLKKVFAKGTSSKEEVLSYVDWKSFKRGFLFVTSDRLLFSNWEIPYNDIDKAILYKTSVLFVPCYVLNIESKENVYKFAFNPSHFWKGDLPFPIERKSIKAKKSYILRILGFIALASILYGIYKHLKGF